MNNIYLNYFVRVLHNYCNVLKKNNDPFALEVYIKWSKKSISIFIPTSSIYSLRRRLQTIGGKRDKLIFVSFLIFMTSGS